MLGYIYKVADYLNKNTVYTTNDKKAEEILNTLIEHECLVGTITFQQEKFDRNEKRVDGKLLLEEVHRNLGFETKIGEIKLVPIYDEFDKDFNSYWKDFHARQYSFIAGVNPDVEQLENIITEETKEKLKNTLFEVYTGNYAESTVACTGSDVAELYAGNYLFQYLRCFYNTVPLKYVNEYEGVTRIEVDNSISMNSSDGYFVEIRKKVIVE